MLLGKMERNKVFKVSSGSDIFVLSFNGREKDFFLEKILKETEKIYRHV